MNGLLITFLLGLFIIIGYVIAIFTKNNKKFMAFNLALAFGVMLLLAFFEILPEATNHLEIGNKFIELIILLVFTFAGILLLLFLDKFIPHHHHDCEHHHLEEEDLNHIGLMSSIAIILHNIIEGMAVFALTNEDVKLGILFALGVGLHNIPLGMMITSTLYKNNKKKTFLIILAVSLSTFIGGLIMFLLSGFISQFILGILLSMTLGMILYLVFFELLHNVLKSKYILISISGVLLGIFLFFLNFILGGHHH